MRNRMSDPSSLPYRPAVGVMLLNDRDEVFVGQRLDSTLEAWQMPQGGIDPGEAPRAAALRELAEETGIAAAKVEVIAEAEAWLDYDLPADLVGKLWKGRYRGQRQKWFAMRFRGLVSDINLKTAHPEFRAWKWADPRDLPALIVPFKRELYTSVLDTFAHILPALDLPMTDKADDSQAEKNDRRWSKTAIGAGIGSAALVAALLYAGRQRKKPTGK